MDVETTKEPLFLTAALHQKIWGGTKIGDYGFKLPSDHTGEAWIISAHPHGPSTVKNGQYEGKTLAEVWQEAPKLFGGHPTDQEFPLLVKILDAKEDLSIQVHPNDTYARAHGEKYGKAESWYILSAEPGAKIYYGHTAKTRKELQEAAENGHIQSILRTVPVKAGDFFYNEAGVLHALGAGIVALETQQSSDMTFRFYDFDRVDATTHQKRALQIPDAVAVTTVPHKDPEIIRSVKEYEAGEVTTLLDAQYFTVKKINVTGTLKLDQSHNYLLQTVVSGDGELVVNNVHYPIKKGTSYILPNDVNEYSLNGQMTLIVSYAN